MHNILDSLKNLKKKSHSLVLSNHSVTIRAHMCNIFQIIDKKWDTKTTTAPKNKKKDNNYLYESSGPSCMYIPNKTKSSSNCIYCQTILRMWNCYNGILTTRTLDSTRWFSEILAKNRHSSWLCHKSLLWWLRWIKSIWIEKKNNFLSM